MHDRSTMDDRLPNLTWQITLAMAMLTAIALNLTGLNIRVELSADALVIIAGYAFLTIYYRFICPKAGVARGFISFGQLVTVVLMGLLLSYAASAVPLPYRDAELYAIDRWLGFEREAYIAFLKRNDGLLDVLSFAYNTMMRQNLLLLFVTITARRTDRLQAYIIAFAIAVTATTAIAIFVPAANAMIYVDKVPTDLSILPDGGHSYFPTLERLRNGELRIIDLGRLEGLISFPSFHTVNAILFVWALWPIRILRFVLVPLNFLLIASTPLCGAHYVTDVAGGAVVAFGAIVATSWLIGVPLANKHLAGVVMAS
jgi:membrane-associated phospholipid phosphatase